MRMVNVWDIVVGVIVAVVILAAVFLCIRNKRRGGCSCGCGKCSYAAGCSVPKEK